MPTKIRSQKKLREFLHELFPRGTHFATTFRKAPRLYLFSFLEPCSTERARAAPSSAQGTAGASLSDLLCMCGMCFLQYGIFITMFRRFSVKMAIYRYRKHIRNNMGMNIGINTGINIKIDIGIYIYIYTY